MLADLGPEQLNEREGTPELRRLDAEASEEQPGEAVAPAPNPSSALETSTRPSGTGGPVNSRIPPAINESPPTPTNVGTCRFGNNAPKGTAATTTAAATTTWGQKSGPTCGGVACCVLQQHTHHELSPSRAGRERDDSWGRGDLRFGRGGRGHKSGVVTILLIIVILLLLFGGGGYYYNGSRRRGL